MDSSLGGPRFEQRHSRCLLDPLPWTLVRAGLATWSYSRSGVYSTFLDNENDGHYLYLENDGH